MNPIPIKWRRASVVYVHDILMASLAFTVAMYLRVGEEIWSTFLAGYYVSLPIFVTIAALSFRSFGMYKGVWRYASLPDLVAIGKSVTITILIFVPVVFLINRLEDMPRSVPLIAWFVLITFIGAPRFIYRIIKDGNLAALKDGDGRGRIPVMLIGARDGTELFIRAMASDREAPYRVIGIIDERNRRVGREILGIPVMGSLDALDGVIAELTRQDNRPQRMIITQLNGALDREIGQKLLDWSVANGIPLARLPSPTDFRTADANASLAPRPVDIEDLLGRPQRTLDMAAISSLVRGKRVLITGAGGSIGGELADQVAALGPERLILADHSEYLLYQIDLTIGEQHPALTKATHLVNIRDKAHLEQVFEAEAPQIVFHAAALKHVPMVELNPLQGVLTNALGTRNVAMAAAAIGAEAMVLISTDKAVHPSSVMGASKRLAEMYCQALDLKAAGDTRFVTVRFGNVLGSTGSVVPLFERQLARGGPLTVTDPNAERYFMTLREAVELVLQASAHAINNNAEQGKILVLDMGEPVRIDDLARQMIRLAGFEPGKDIEIAYTGLRPGEKLAEELLYDVEAITETGTDGVMVASPQSSDLAFVDQVFRDLERFASAGETEATLDLVRRVVPTLQVQRTEERLKAGTQGGAAEPDPALSPEDAPESARA